MFTVTRIGAFSGMIEFLESYHVPVNSSRGRVELTWNTDRANALIFPNFDAADFAAKVAQGSVIRSN